MILAELIHYHFIEDNPNGVNELKNFIERPDAMLEQDLLQLQDKWGLSDEETNPQRFRETALKIIKEIEEEA